MRRVAGQSDQLLSNLEFPIVVAQPLKLQTEQLASLICGHRAKRAANRAADEGPERAASDRKHRFERTLGNATDRLTNTGIGEVFDGLAGRIDQVAEEVFELLLVGDLEQLGGTLKLLHFAERFELAFLLGLEFELEFELVLRFGFGFGFGFELILELIWQLRLADVQGAV